MSREGAPRAPMGGETPPLQLHRRFELDRQLLKQKGFVCPFETLVKFVFEHWRIRQNRDKGPALTLEPLSFMSPFHHEKVLSVQHWTDRLFSFRTTRTPTFRFRSGQFVMMGLPGEGSRSCAPIRWPAPITTTTSSSSRSRFPTDR